MLIGKVSMEQELAQYQFKHIDPVGQLQTLKRIVLNSCVDLQHLQALDSAIDKGSHKLHPSKSTLKERDMVKFWRRKAIALLGIDNPQHALHQAWKKSGSEHGIPAKLYHTLITLDDISTGRVVETAQKAPFLLNKRGEDLSMQSGILGRFASFLGWQGSTEALIIDSPEVLLTSLPSLRVLARIAVWHTAPELKHMSQDDLAHSIGHRPHTPIESHLLAIIKYGNNYTFGTTTSSIGARDRVRPTKGMLRSRLLQCIDTDEPRIHSRVLKAYFSQFPPNENELLRFPKIRRYIKPHYLRTPEAAVIKKYVTGEERWLNNIMPTLNQLAHTTRMTWLSKLNKTIIEGSKDLHKMRPGSPEYEAIAKGRAEFYLLLGWCKPSHKFFSKYEKFCASHGSLLPPAPKGVIEILNILDKHSMDVERTLSAFFGIIGRRADLIERKITIIKCRGYHPSEVNIGLLKCSDHQLVNALDR